MSHDNPGWVPQKEVEFASSEKGKKEQEVRLGQFFPVFPQGFTERIISGNKPSRYDTYKILLTPQGERLRFLATADNGFLDPGYPIVAPFTPETGYRIDDYDFDEVTGPYKLRQWLRSFEPSTSDPLPLSLINISPEAHVDPPVSDTTYQMLDKLQLQVIANGLRVQSNKLPSKPSDEVKIMFNTFYPMDTPPLPYLPDGGFRLCLPDDLTKLRTIQARFILP